MTTKALTQSPTQKMAVMINAPNIKAQFDNCLKETRHYSYRQFWMFIRLTIIYRNATQKR